ncbi:uncharacterized protein LOC123440559 isoform X2 [Hordeum vulgare subsp. vulgare]|uniref:uncharacterized protein LOC123440559 isoform X2 n=1 Tax=Hordeum vulgare subsp. vulgare TaxID=112509 RepID=UPI001D1A51C0|nr:uncharacterized protein LOC123440559 isoform X2 [Hordeum vulgare subsp. vulgare]
MLGQLTQPISSWARVGHGAPQKSLTTVMRRVLLPPSDVHTAASRVPGGTGLGGAMEEKRGREGRGGKKEAEKGERAAAYQRRHRLPPRRGSRLERNRAKMNGAERSGLDLLLDLLHLLKQGHHQDPYHLLL